MNLVIGDPTKKSFVKLNLDWNNQQRIMDHIG